MGKSQRQRLGALSERESPEDALHRVLQTSDQLERQRIAEEALAANVDELAPDTHFLLLRQVYLSHLIRHEFQAALSVAETMAGLETDLTDLAQHDASRASQALGNWPEAIGFMRLASRSAPAERRSFQLWSLAIMEHFAGNPSQALRSLRRALRYTRGDGALLRAHAALIDLERGEAVPELSELISTLRSSKAVEGYGAYVLGMIYDVLGNDRDALVYLRRFLTRNADEDTAKTLTLREELRRARLVVARLASD